MNERVTVVASGTTTNLISPVPLDTLYKVTVGGVVQPFNVDYSSRGFAQSQRGQHDNSAESLGRARRLGRWSRQPGW